MSNVQAISGGVLSSNNLFVGSPTQTEYQWKNLVIEKRISMNWAYKLSKGNVLHAFWTVLSSPIS